MRLRVLGSAVVAQRVCATYSAQGATSLPQVGAVFGKTWGVSNPEILKGHQGRVVEITGTIDAHGDSIHINKVSDIACGPKLCERQCKGKCGNGSACDCPK